MQHLFGTVIFRKKAGRDDVDPFVRALRRQDDGHEKLEIGRIMKRRLQNTVCILKTLQYCRLFFFVMTILFSLFLRQQFIEAARLITAQVEGDEGKAAIPNGLHNFFPMGKNGGELFCSHFNTGRVAVPTDTQ